VGVDDADDDILTDNAVAPDLSGVNAVDAPLDRVELLPRVRLLNLRLGDVSDNLLANGLGARQKGKLLDEFEGRAVGRAASRRSTSRSVAPSSAVFNKMADAAANAAMDLQASVQTKHPSTWGHTTKLDSHLLSDYREWHTRHILRLAPD
jgi:hypothetical protein